MADCFPPCCHYHSCPTGSGFFALLHSDSDVVAAGDQDGTVSSEPVQVEAAVFSCWRWVAFCLCGADGCSLCAGGTHGHSAGGSDAGIYCGLGVGNLQRQDRA